ncbi:MAG TPA: hypothetical protein VH593_22680 [Ktedonobacteraceae bacterium]|jgi:hypothetical protein
MVRVFDPNIFGTLFTSHEVEQAALNTLAKWMYTYLREVERQLELPYNTIPDPKRYTNRNEFDAVPGEDLSRIVVVAGPMSAAPYINGYGQYMASWRVGVGSAANHEDILQAKFITSCYSTAVRGIMVQQSSLGGVANMTDWIQSNPVDLPIRDQLLQYSSILDEFNVQIPDVVTKGKGPDQPDVPPGHDHGPYPIVEEVFIELYKEPFDGS